MPHYFFNVYDGSSLRDDQGISLPSAHEARVTAIGLAGAILRDDAAKIACGSEWRMEVTDPTGMILYRLDFTVDTLSAVAELPSRHARRA